MKKIVFGFILLIAFFLLLGCTDITIVQDNNGPVINIGDGSNDGSGVVVKSDADCPSSLQACGKGCIPTNALCCDDGIVNTYCLQPAKECVGTNCSSCPEGQVFCGMFCKNKGEDCCVGNDCGAVAAGGVQTGSNPYTGTYEFKGIYEYKWADSDDYATCGKSDGWNNATLTMRVTFEPIPNAELGTWDDYTVSVKKLWVDDPDFGTGSDGVAPVDNTGKGYTKLFLPLLPRSAEDPLNYAVTPEKNGKPFEDPISGHSITFVFPFVEDDAHPRGTTIDVTAVGMLYSEGYYVSPDGSEFHSYSHTPGDQFMTSNTWEAWSSAGTGPLVLDNQLGLTRKECAPKFISWTFKKISD